ncbi:MAG: S-layer homology domain-containing protein [Clostridia bacterium]|nr:S-layer homology domain-containing protein [Clostridia bacterium]
MTKRILSLLLAAMMVLGSIVIVSAAETDYVAENTWAVEVLTKINVLQGDENGDPMLDNPILRYEMALFLARALTGNTDDAYWAKVENETPFDDLLTHPYNGAATWNYNHGIILGVTDTIFNPNGNITYQDAIVMIVRAWADHFVWGGLDALGFKDELHYPWKHIELADDLGLTVNIDPSEKYLEATSRGVVAQLVYNLLVWDPATCPDYIEKKADGLKYDDSIGSDNFNLEISAKDGDTFVATEIKDGKVALDEKGSATGTDLTLAETEFARFELTAKKDSYYKIIYYTVKDDTVVTSIVQVSKDGAQYTNKPGDRDFDVVYEATAWKDNDKTKEATEWKIVGIVIDGTTYSIGAGKDPLTLAVTNADISGFAFDKLDKATVAEYEAILDSLYGTLALTDTNGDGKMDKITITPYVFAAIYKEVRVDADSTTDLSTEWVFDGYAVVSYADATKTTKGTDYAERTWTWTVADAAGKKDTGATQTLTENTAEYVATTAAATLATATKLSAVKVNYFDVDVDSENKWIKFVGDTTEYGWGYADLLAWDIYEAGEGVATYFDLARVYGDEATYLLELFGNKNVADADVNSANNLKYVNVWTIDGNVVALEPATSDGSSGGTTPSTPTIEYNGIILVDQLDASDIDIEKDTIKLVNNKYYFVTEANVDGTTKTVLVYLADKSGFKFDKTNSNSEKVQELVYYNTKINDAFATIEAASASGILPVVFYKLDVNGNIVLVLDKDVTGENYKTYVGGDYVVKAGSGETITNVKYEMDISSTDFITYTVTKNSNATDKYITSVANADTAWLFVSDDEIRVEAGSPEFGSNFTVAATTDIVKKDNTYVVFPATIEGFNYSMFAAADYVIYDGSDARNDMKRDGYLYYDVIDLFTGAEYTMRVDENDEETLAKLDSVTYEAIVAVEHTNKHDLLEVYTIEEGAIKAIASLRYGTSAFVATGVNSVDGLVDRIKTQYNLTTIAANQMANNEKNIIYAVDASTDTLDVLTAAAAIIDTDDRCYVFYTAAASGKPASYVVIICD